MTAERFSLKDHLFNRAKVQYLGGLLADVVDGLDQEQFESDVMTRLPDLELKARIALIADVLDDHLDTDFELAARQIRAALPPPLDPALTDDDFGDFIFAPLGRYVENNGIGHYETSMALIKDLTMRFSMEGSVRTFIDQRPAETLRIFETWARDDNYHVRRLVSESTRPLLPWAPRISLEASEPIHLLDMLHADPTRYVTRSVANHLNDISKIDPSLVIAALRRWHGAGRQDPAELDWLTGHALRTLIKRGDAEAIRLLGYSPHPDVVVGPISLATPTVRAGEALEFSVTITAGSPERLLVDYSIAFVKKNGGTSPRVFKLKKTSLARAESITLSKRHPLKADATTYSLYPGEHRVSLLVNGTLQGEAVFDVETG